MFRRADFLVRTLVFFVSIVVAIGVMILFTRFACVISTNVNLPVFFGLFSVNIVGFVFPAVISCFLFLFYVLRVRFFSRVDLLYLFLVIGIAVFSVFVFSLEHHFVDGSSLDVGVVVITVLYLLIVTVGSPVMRYVPVSFMVGFFAGFVSDLETLARYTPVFGGAGLVDGDLIFPLMLLLTVLLYHFLMKHLHYAF
jgi:hypothetical protein